MSRGLTPDAAPCRGNDRSEYPLGRVCRTRHPTKRESCPEIPNGSGAFTRRGREISLHRTPPGCTVSRRRTHPRGPSLHPFSQRLGHQRNVSLNFCLPPVRLLAFFPSTYFSACQIEEAVSEQRHFIRAAQKTGPTQRGSFPLPPVRARHLIVSLAGWLAGWWGWVAPAEPVQCRSTLFFPGRQPHFGRDTFNLLRAVPRRMPLGSVINMYIYIAYCRCFPGRAWQTSALW